ncbi:type IV toxin-antitoxin system AbiEi family antitoxin domain-containing protein [Breznakia pachnodae]|uniref:Transcriptional regulator of viral defense system n=1 Tax=Breznakia pachnodae TaxID=265178 RepID=A0ABU0E8X2_9FIRM|nr:hypothetical protein [Breznakia pachnodae]MDQ0363143.1 putative transcriptional regulator of viral defense system [Breznakia pachnodae]
MLYSYKELIDKYKTKYALKKLLDNNYFVKIDNGYYSDTPYYDELELIFKKYLGIILNDQSAFFYHGLSDYIPDKYFVATKQKAKKINFESVVQIYVSNKFYGLGKMKINVIGVNVSIYDKERMLIELFRSKKNYSYDYYKEIVKSFREIIDELDMDKLIKYLEKFSNGDNILERINMEIF